MLQNDNLNDDNDLYNPIPADQLALIHNLLYIQHPQVIGILNELGFEQNPNPNQAFNNLAYPDDEDIDEDYIPEDDNSSEGSDSVDFDLYMVDNRDLVLHDASLLIDNQHYPGPRGSPVLDPHALCDCLIFNNGNGQCLLDNLENNWLEIDFLTELNDANLFYQQNIYREANNLQRKRMYRDIWFKLANHIQLEHDEETNRYARVRLPNCAYALVRQIWPSLTGRYMGFRVH